MNQLVVPDKGRSVAAFSSKLLCPYCGKDRWKFVENVSRYRIRYQCRGCSKTIQYDYSNNLDHPYAAFGKPKWQRLVESFRQKRASTLESLKRS